MLSSHPTFQNNHSNGNGNGNGNNTDIGTDTQQMLQVVGDANSIKHSNKDESNNNNNNNIADAATSAALALEFGYRYDGDSTAHQDYPDDEEQSCYYPYDDADAAAKAEATAVTSQPSSNEFWKTKTYTTVVVARTQERHQVPFMYLLGSVLHPIHDQSRRRQLEQNLFWFTYRYDFLEIKPYQITTDAGWGCMLRSAQMLLAHTLRIHFSPSNLPIQCNYDNNNNSSSSNNSNIDFTNRLLTWFLDVPSTDACFYSLHNMCAAGLAKYQVLPGEWYGPGTACYVLRDLVDLHQEEQPQTPLFRVHVATEGTVYRQVIEDLMTKEGRAKRQKETEITQQQQQQQESPTTKINAMSSSHPLDDPLQSTIPSSTTSTTSSSKSQQMSSGRISLEWDTSLLLMIPLRLGLDKFQPQYVQSLARTFALPQSVGILGGRPRGARWFFGSYADGSKIFGLDPHTVQPAVSTQLLPQILRQGRLPAEFLQSVHTEYPDTMELIRMDPSIALGFYCRNRKEFVQLEQSLQAILSDVSGEASTTTTTTTAPPLVTFMEQAPNYETETTVAADMMNGMLLHDDDDDDDALIGGPRKSTALLDTDKSDYNYNNKLNDDDDDEDYVLL